MNTFLGSSVAITGAGGSIGFQLCREALRGKADELRLISLTEAGLYDATRRLKKEFPDARIRPILGSYGNPQLVRKAISGVDLLIHAGAHKHVPMCEENPLEAIANNVLGTRVLLSEACSVVDQICVISTDKAVKPQSIMGATKRVVEKLAATYSSMHASVSVVRFGNVMDSAGSVFPLWREQIAAGGPVTLTDDRCERYFMSIPEAINLVIRAIDHGSNGRIYVLNMGERIKLIDIAVRLIRESGKDIDIAVTGLRPGEKIIEELTDGGPMTPICEGVSMLTEKPEYIDTRVFAALETAYDRYDQTTAVANLWRLVR
jgi:FlaA1/EpsC-like NDP-sugar epimerase